MFGWIAIYSKLYRCEVLQGKPAQRPQKTAVFLRMTDKHANLCLFPCLFSFPLGFAWYHNFPCGVDTEESCFAHIQTILYYFLKRTVNNFSCSLLFLFMSLFFLHTDHNCCLFPWSLSLSLSHSLSLSLSLYLSTLSCFLSTAAWCGWKKGGLGSSPVETE